jgi:glycosyltransferase involved in cell wall biosynthesis
MTESNRSQKAALIFRERLLPPSETFIVEQARVLKRYKPVLTGVCRTKPSLQHSLPQVLVSDGAGHAARLIAAMYRKMPGGFRVFEKLKAYGPSIVHAHFALDGVQAIPIAEKLELPLIVSLHGFDVTCTEDALRNSASGRHYLVNQKRLFSQASAFVCVSQSIRRAALRAGFPESKLHVHYTGVDCRRFRPSEVIRDPKLIVFVGRLVEKKGCDYLLRAMELVQKKHPSARLEIIGDGPLRPQLQELANTLGVHATFRGMQNPDEVQQSMSRARILCNPSVTAPSGDMEGFGMVFAEAQALGTPVVSFAHAAIPEAVNHGVTGLLSAEGEILPLAQSLITLLEEDRLWASMSHEAIAWVRNNFDLDCQTVKLEELYDRCCSN